MRTLLLAMILGCHSLSAAQGPGTFLLPLSCGELLPDPSPFLSFFESVANGAVNTDKKLSTRLYQILALRDKLNSLGGKSRENNHIDRLIHKTLCFYREQREPLQPVPYDDPRFLEFIRSSMKELEQHAEQAVYDAEYEKARRKEYENLLEHNREIVDRLKDEAERQADRSYARLSKAARKKVATQ